MRKTISLYVFSFLFLIFCLVVYSFPAFSENEFVDLDNKGMKLSTVNLRYLSASEATVLLQKALSSKGDIWPNEVSNNLVITDFPENIHKIKEVIRSIDFPPIQVLIEVKLADIADKDYQNLDALIKSQRARLLASPSLVTLNGKEARFVIGERYPYEVIAGTAKEANFVDVGTTLWVTPKASADGWITMSVRLKTSSLTKTVLNAVPGIVMREADSTVRVRDGQTVVIGGLVKKQDGADKGILLGSDWFPNRLGENSAGAELAVFITPRVIRSEGGPGIFEAGPTWEPAPAETQKDKEIAIGIKKSQERLYLSQLWSEAGDLEGSKGVISRGKDKPARMAEALKRYKEIIANFSDSPRADEAFYRAGIITYEYFKDSLLAKKIFILLIERYPGSRFLRKSRNIVRDVGYKEVSARKTADTSLIKKELKTAEGNRINARAKRKMEEKIKKELKSRQAISKQAEENNRRKEELAKRSEKLKQKKARLIKEKLDAGKKQKEEFTHRREELRQKKQDFAARKREEYLEKERKRKELVEKNRLEKQNRIEKLQREKRLVEEEKNKQDRERKKQEDSRKKAFLLEREQEGP